MPKLEFHRTRVAAICSAVVLAVLGLLLAWLGSRLETQGDPLDHPLWSALPRIELKGGFKAYYDIGTPGRSTDWQTARDHGFSTITLINPYRPRAGVDRVHGIEAHTRRNRTNPWSRPEDFAVTVDENLRLFKDNGPIVLDIEIAREDSARVAWGNRDARNASGAPEYDAFVQLYYQAWASWYRDPVAAARVQFPGQRVGIYGLEASRRLFHGEPDPKRVYIDGVHASDSMLWQYVEPYLDFAVSSIYLPMADASAFYYMAANVQENVRKMNANSKNPILAYVWLRYHQGSRVKPLEEVDPEFAEAMAILPWFYGAKGIVLWGYEPDWKHIDRAPNRNMATFMASLARFAQVSDQVGGGRFIEAETETPARIAWYNSEPLIRRVRFGERKCVVMAVHPHLRDGATSTIFTTCDGDRVPIELVGTRISIAMVDEGRVRYH